MSENNEKDLPVKAGSESMQGLGMAIVIDVEVKIGPGEYKTIRIDEAYLMKIAEKKAEAEWYCDPYPTAMSVKLVVEA